MAMIDDVYEAAEAAGIEVTDRTKVHTLTAGLKSTSAGKVAVFVFQMKPGAVTFPAGLQEYDGKIVMEE